MNAEMERQIEAEREKRYHLQQLGVHGKASRVAGQHGTTTTPSTSGKSGCSRSCWSAREAKTLFHQVAAGLEAEKEKEQMTFTERLAHEAAKRVSENELAVVDAN